MNSEPRKFMKINPRAKTNSVAALFFLHMIPIFWRNWKKQFTEEDLYDVLDEHKASALGNSLDNIWKKQCNKHPKYALHWTLLKVYTFELAIAGALNIITEVSKIVVLPIGIGKLVSYFEKGPPEVSQEQVYVYATAVSVVLLLDNIISHPLLLWLMHMSMKIRVACSSLIYRKSLRLSKTAMEQTTVGHIINLLSNDVRKFDEGLFTCHFIIVAPIQAAVGIYLLYQVIGISAFAGMVFLLLLIPLQLYFGKLNSIIRLNTATRTDERVRLMNEVLSGIQVIKMYTWEKPFSKLVALARRYEMKSIRKRFYTEAILLSSDMFVARTSIFITIMIYICMGHNITANKAYFVTSIYSILRPIVFIFAFNLTCLGEIHTSILRLQEFLKLDELAKHDMKSKGDRNVITKEPRIVLDNISVKWANVSENNLNDINLNIENKQLIGIIGPVGSGKSTLISTMLKELEITKGCMELVGKVSYASQDPWLFSASVKQNILFNNKYDEERYKTVLNICALDSDIKMLPYGDSTIVGEKGKSLSGGQRARVNLARCVYSKADIYLLDDPLSAVDSKVGKKLYSTCIRTFLLNKLCILVTHQLHYLKDADQIVILQSGRIESVGKFDALQSSGLDFARLLQQFHPSSEGVLEENKYAVNLEDECDAYQDMLHNKETTASGSISIQTYLMYLRFGGGTFFTILVVAVVIAAHVVSGLGDYFVSYWVKLEQAANLNPEFANTTFSKQTVIYTYTGITATTIILALTHTVLFFTFSIRASINIHNTIFNKITQGTMKFFNENPTGRILNRFSKDMGVIDEYIPSIVLDVVTIFLIFAAALVLTSVVNPWFVLPSIFVMGLFYLMRIFYLHTSRSVKRVEGITRSPIFNHLTATMNGLPTIRAFEAEKVLINEFDNHLDVHSSAWYLFISASRAFGFFMDLLCVVLISFIIFALIVLNKGYYGGEVGLIITQMLNFTGILQWGMRQFTELENHMTSVERVLEYTMPEIEPSRKEINNLPRFWPEYGKVVFKNVSLKYNNELSVLRNLNFEINPQEKIGIVGRTGAGKTSIIAALFQLYDIEGSILIDEVDITKLPQQVLRSRISIIPQEPVLFSANVRKNLDPFEEYNDDALWNALHLVELKEVVQAFPEGLNALISEGGSNFSIGQRQLLCLARAVIRHSKILVLDEATANVDPYTDNLIQKTIRTEFSKCTVITIAHRLHTIMDSDKILVLDHGNILEYGPPSDLLQNPNSFFYSMVQTSGAVDIEKVANNT